MARDWRQIKKPEQGKHRSVLRQPDEVPREQMRKILRWFVWGFVTVAGLYALWYVAALVYWNFAGESFGL